MKRKSPMQMNKATPAKKTAKSDAKPKQDKKPGRKLSAMERYANERNANLKMASEPALMQHDPQSDVYHLQKAAEVRGDESRHRRAREHAAKTVKMLHKAMMK